MNRRLILLFLSFLVSAIPSSFVLANPDSCTPYAKLYQVDGVSYDEELGFSVAGAGDVDGDGRADFIVGSPLADPDGNINAGSAYIYSGATGSLIFQKNGFGHFGWSVSSAGDVNGDGNSDFIVGAYRNFPNGIRDAGSAFVYSGADGSLLFQINGSDTGDVLGFSVAGVGDINGDGKGDFIAGAPVASPNGIEAAGSAFVYSGRDGSILYDKHGTDTGDQFGISVDGAGDVNGDGKPDFIVGANRANPGGRDNAGSAFVFSGADGSLLFRIDGDTESGDGMGWSVAGLEDINGDGNSDFIIGTVNSSFVHSGADGSLLYKGGHGNSVAAAGDVDGDTKPDFIVGPMFLNYALVYSGGDGSLISTITINADAEFGRSVAGIGDTDGDGKSEVIVGAPSAVVNEVVGAGSAFVFKIQPAAKKGDLNGDGYIGPADVVGVLNAVFLGSSLTVPFCAADVYCDGILDPIDVVYELDIVFLGMSIPFTVCLPY